jgi:hypothetical protein
LVLRYTIATRVGRDRKTGEYAVVDVVTFDSGRRREVVRFRGTQQECHRVADKVGAYWRKVLGSKPPIT